MNIDKFKGQHVAILDGIACLREAVRDGVEDNAERIASLIVKISGVVKLHLFIEDSILYPQIAASADSKLARLGERYKHDMHGISEEFFSFASHWNLPARVVAEPERFRQEANKVLRVLFERMKREDREFYPLVESGTHSSP